VARIQKTPRLLVVTPLIRNVKEDRGSRTWEMKYMVKFLALTLCLAVPITAMGQPVRQHCMAVFRADTSAMENPAAVMKAGQGWGPITQVRVTKSNGQMSYCAHGDYCYPAIGVVIVSACVISDKPIPPIGHIIDAEWLYELY
jgi:hypothetical protein